MVGYQFGRCGRRERWVTDSGADRVQFDQQCSQMGGSLMGYLIDGVADREGEKEMGGCQSSPQGR